MSQFSRTHQVIIGILSFIAVGVYCAIGLVGLVALLDRPLFQPGLVTSTPVADDVGDRILQLFVAGHSAGLLGRGIELTVPEATNPQWVIARASENIWQIGLEAEVIDNDQAETIHIPVAHYDLNRGGYIYTEQARLAYNAVGRYPFTDYILLPLNPPVYAIGETIPAGNVYLTVHQVEYRANDRPDFLTVLAEVTVQNNDRESYNLTPSEFSVARPGIRYPTAGNPPQSGLDYRQAIPPDHYIHGWLAFEVPADEDDLRLEFFSDMAYVLVEMPPLP